MRRLAKTPASRRRRQHPHRQQRPPADGKIDRLRDRAADTGGLAAESGAERDHDVTRSTGTAGRSGRWTPANFGEERLASEAAPQLRRPADQMAVAPNHPDARYRRIALGRDPPRGGVLFARVIRRPRRSRPATRRVIVRRLLTIRAPAGRSSRGRDVLAVRHDLVADDDPGRRGAGAVCRRAGLRPGRRACDRPIGTSCSTPSTTPPMSSR
jgi:hypothetical protein